MAHLKRKLDFPPWRTNQQKKTWCQIFPIKASVDSRCPRGNIREVGKFAPLMNNFAPVTENVRKFCSCCCCCWFSPPQNPQCHSSRRSLPLIRRRKVIQSLEVIRTTTGKKTKRRKNPNWHDSIRKTSPNTIGSARRELAACHRDRGPNPGRAQPLICQSKSTHGALGTRTKWISSSHLRQLNSNQKPWNLSLFSSGIPVSDFVSFFRIKGALFRFFFN